MSVRVPYGAREERLMERCVRRLDKIQRLLDSREHVDNILLLGTPGVGKSSFINALRACLSGEYREKAHAASYGGGGKTMTVQLNWYPRCGLDEAPSPVNNHNIPHLGDMAGLGNDADMEKVKVILSLIIDGHIPPKINILDLMNEDVEDIPLMFRDRQEKWRVKKVVFIASSRDPLPEKLIDCLLSVVRSDTGLRPRWIPLYGVLTKRDLVVDANQRRTGVGSRRDVDEETITKDDFNKKEKQFLQKLGISKTKYMEWVNYRDEQDYPDFEIEDQCLCFLEKLCEDNADECKYPEVVEYTRKELLRLFYRRTVRKTRKMISSQGKVLIDKPQFLLIPIFVILIAIVLWVFLTAPRPVGEPSVDIQQTEVHNEIPPENKIPVENKPRPATVQPPSS